MKIEVLKKVLRTLNPPTISSSKVVESKFADEKKMNIVQKSTTTNQITTGLGRNRAGFESKINRLKRNSQLIGSPTSPSFNDRSTSLNKKIKVEYENRFNQYEFSLNLYTIPPFDQINLEEAQKAVEERLKGKFELVIITELINRT